MVPTTYTRDDCINKWWINIIFRCDLLGDAFTCLSHPCKIHVPCIYLYIGEIGRYRWIRAHILRLLNKRLEFEPKPIHYLHTFIVQGMNGPTHSRQYTHAQENKISCPNETKKALNIRGFSANETCNVNDQLQNYTHRETVGPSAFVWPCRIPANIHFAFIYHFVESIL